MPDGLVGTSEFGGGGTQRHLLFPPPHVATPEEQLRLLKVTGETESVAAEAVYDEGDGMNRGDNDERYSGLLPTAEQEKKARDAGLLDKGQVWKEMTGG